MNMNEKPRSGLLTTGGVLAVISGAFGAFVGTGLLWTGLMGFDFSMMNYYHTDVMPWPFITAGVIAIALSVMAVVGGAFSLARRSWGVALAGGICALLVNTVLGMLALVFIAVSKDQFA